MRVMLVAYPLETVLLGALAIVVGGPFQSGAVLWGGLYGIGMAFGMWAFFAALGAGPISVVSPLAAVLNAAVPVALGEQAPHACKLSPLVFARMSATLVVLLMSGASKNLRLPRGKPLKLALGLALLDICANVAMLVALHRWLLSLASILISLYPAATVVLAMVILRERVSRCQGVGMVMAMGSVAMIAAS